MARPQLLLCYHKVGPAAEEGRWLNVEPDRLRAHVRYFLRRGWGFRTASHAHLREPGTVGFQFDDAYDSALRHTIPIFDDSHVPATFWVVPSLVGDHSRWDGQKAAPLANWDQLIDAQKAGHEIGNHTSSHPRLSSLDNVGQRDEIAGARAMLSERGVPTDTLCFPYGDHNGTTLFEMKDLGLKAGFTVAKRPAQASDDVLALPRIVVAYSDTVAGLLYKTYIRPHLP